MLTRSEDKNSLAGVVILLLSALAFGLTFVFQKQAAETVDATSVVALRFCIGAAALALMIVLNDAFRRKKGYVVFRFDKNVLVGGALSGICLYVASVAQQAGLESTTAGKAGFITAMYIMIVPLMGLLAGKRTRANVWFAVPVAIAGFWMMSVTGDDLTVGEGDLFVLLSSFCYALQILFIDEFSEGEDPFKFTFTEFAVASIIAVPVMLANGAPSPAALRPAVWSLLYMGVVASAVGYGLQVVGQQKVNPAAATMLLSTESVIALFGGAIILHEANSATELGGCLLVFLGVFITQLQFSPRFLPAPTKRSLTMRSA